MPETIHKGLPDGPSAIREGRDGSIYVAVCGPDGIVVRRSDTDWQTVYEGSVNGLHDAPDGDAWIARSDAVVCVRPDGTTIDHTASIGPTDTPGPILVTRLGDVWCTGCASMRRGDGNFAVVPPAPSGWSISPRCDDSFGNLWAVADDGRRRDLAILNAEHSHTWRLIELPAEYGSQPWSNVITDDSGYLWIGLERDLLRVDPRAKSDCHIFASPTDAPITTVGRIAGRQVAVGFADGSIAEITVSGDEEPEWHKVRSSGNGPVRALLHDRSGTLWSLADGKIRVDALQEPWHDHWEEQPRMPAGNHDHIFARIGDRLYTAGGKTFYGYPADEWVNLDHVWSCDVRDRTWRVEVPMLEPGKAYSGITSKSGELWLLGGNFRDAAARHGTRSTDTVEIYDPETGRIRPGPPLPRPGDQIVALTVDDCLYAIGGNGEDGPTNDVVAIAAGESEWTPRAPAPGPVFQASGCVLDDRIYVAAGPGSNCPGLFVYDPAQDAWTQVEHPAERPPGAPLCASFSGRVWVMGGRGKNGGQTATWIYAPGDGTWEQGPDIPLPTSWAAAADVDGLLLIAGGAYEDDRVGGFFNTDRAFLLRENSLPA